MTAQTAAGRTVYHGLPSIYWFQPKSDDYLASLSRISPEKGCDRAVEIARRNGLRLRIVAKMDRADREYFGEIKALRAKLWVEFIREISDTEKSAFLGGARALLAEIEVIASGVPLRKTDALVLADTPRFD